MFRLDELEPYRFAHRTDEKIPHIYRFRPSAQKRFSKLISWLVGRSVRWSVTHSFNDPHVAPIGLLGLVISYFEIPFISFPLESDFLGIKAHVDETIDCLVDFLRIRGDDQTHRTPRGRGRGGRRGLMRGGGVGGEERRDVPTGGGEQLG